MPPIDSIPLQYIIAAIFIGIWGIVRFKTPLLSFFSKLRGEAPSLDSYLPATVEDDTVDSDKPAPIGTTEYLTLVITASPDATDKLRMEYAMAELTEAQILRAEVLRKVTPAPVKKGE